MHRRERRHPQWVPLPNRRAQLLSHQYHQTVLGDVPSCRIPRQTKLLVPHMTTRYISAMQMIRPPLVDALGRTQMQKMTTAVLGHFSDTLKEMANSIIGLEEGYFKALCEVIDETERVLWDVSCIDAHYVSRVVTVMSSWQEVVQTVVSHTEGVDLTTLPHPCQEDAWRATHEYVGRQWSRPTKNVTPPMHRGT